MRKYFYIAVVFFSFGGCVKDNSSAHTNHTSDHKHNANQIYLTQREKQMAGVGIDTVKTVEMSESNKIIGIAAVDENKKQVISARLNGRLDLLFVRNPGEKISSGTKLYSIYSEELLAEENTYLLALKNASITGKEIAEASRKKMVLWGMTEKQISDLGKTKNPSASLIFYSQTNGILSTSFVNEGQYVQAGMSLFELTDLSGIWIEAQIYPNEISNIKMNDEALITFHDLPQQSFSGRVAFENPVLEKNSKITLIRFYIDNKARLIRPGMMAEINFQKDEMKTLVIPKSAMLMEKDKAVWVEISEGLYEKRMVMTGMENKMQIEIMMGLKEGEHVVTAGVYLINSEFILQNGANAMSGMKM